MKNVLTLTWLTFHEALRRRMVLAALVLGALFVLLYDLGLAFLLNQVSNGPSAANISQSVYEQSYNFVLTAGIYVVHFLTVMLAIFASVDAISGEITSHAIQTVVTKPVRRWEVVLGKWIGYAIMIIPYMVLLSGGIFLSVMVGTRLFS